MSQQTTPEPTSYPTTPLAEAPVPRGNGNRNRYRLVAVIVIVIAAGLVAWLALRDHGKASSGASSTTAASIGQLQALATSLGQPIFWLGPKAGSTYELAQASNGSIYIRYLPQGVAVGAKAPYLTVATYPFPGAYAAIQAVTKQSGSTAVPLSSNGLAEISSKVPTSVHAAYPGVDYQVEVFDPTPGRAASLVKAGQLAVLGKLNPSAATPAPPFAASPAKLKALARSHGRPIYWAGKKNGYTYEVTKTPSGQITLRYLPPGKKVGATGEYTTIGTYPYANAFAAVKALAREPKATVIKMPRGGLAVVDKNGKTNIHLAFPGSNYQIEVFSPSPATARQLVASGRLKSTG